MGGKVASLDRASLGPVCSKQDLAAWTLRKFMSLIQKDLVLFGKTQPR